jgi:endonuclease YncB( thermonuclease family)
VPLPIRRPRRIFRSGSLGSGNPGRLVSPTVMAGLLGAAGGAAIMLFSLPAALFGRVPLPSGVLAADAPLVAVVDGETLRLRETVVHLQGVEAPARGQTCRAPEGRCDAAGNDVNRALVAAGWAKARAEMPELAAEEATAQAQHLGLWRAGGQTAPF